MKRRKTGLFIATIAMTIFGLTTSQAVVERISLGNTKGFSLLVGGGLTNTGTSLINGDLGLSPTISYVDTGLLTIKGNYHFGDTKAKSAQTDLTTAYNKAVSETPSVTIASELAGQTLKSGIYKSDSGFNINGTLTLDGQNQSSSLFIFQTPLALNTAASSKVVLINGARACNIFWQVGTTTTLGSGSDFKGNLLGKGSFVSGAGLVISGRVLVSQGAVALNSTQIVSSSCDVGDEDENGNGNKNLSTGSGA